MKKVLLGLSLVALATTANAQICSELFFSEYVEGSGNNKAIEIYNPTSAAINLSNYRVVRYSNGSAVGTDSVNLSGTLASNDVHVLVNGQTTTAQNSPACDPALQAIGDQLAGAYPDPMYMNGDDAVLLVKISPYTIIDIFGKIGEDPGQSWSDVFPHTDAQGSWWTKDHSMVRKATVTSGVMVNPLAFDPTLQYDSLPQDTWTSLGAHTCACASIGINENNAATNKVNLFPNPTSGLMNVSANDKIVSMVVYNAIGQAVMSKTYTADEQRKQQSIDLSTAPAGIYMVEVKLADGRQLVSKVNVN